MVQIKRCIFGAQHTGTKKQSWALAPILAAMRQRVNNDVMLKSFRLWRVVEIF